MIKRVLFFMLVMFVAVSAFADEVHREDGEIIYITQTMTLSADASAVYLGGNLCGGYLFSVEIISTADDAMTFSIASQNGTTLYTTTTTAATSGQIENPTGMWPMNCTGTDRPTYTLSGLGSGSVVIEITVVKR